MLKWFLNENYKNNFLVKLSFKDGQFVLKKGSTVSQNVSMYFKSNKTVIKC